MKVLMTNSKNLFKLASQLYLGLSKMDIKIFSFYPYEIAEKYDASPTKKIINTLYPIHLSKKISNVLLTNVEKHNPDIVFIVKGYFITPATLKKIKSKGIKLINYNPDHPFRLSGKQRVDNIKGSVNLYDSYITYSENIRAALERKFPHLHTSVIPFAYHQEFIMDLEKSQDHPAVCFIGNPDSYRKSIIEQIANSDIPIVVYGSNWTKYLSSHKNITIHEVIEGKQYYQTLRDYRVQLNLFRKQNYGSHNMRSFEIVAAGGIMLCPEDSDHDKFFYKDSEYFSYSDRSNLIDKIKLLLAKPRHEIEAIRIKVQEKCINGNHNYDNRSLAIYDIFSKSLA